MLTSMRNAFATGIMRWVLIVIMSILIFSFAIWGIGDTVRGFGRDVVATVGSTDIAADRFRQEYDRVRQNLARQTGRPLTPEQSRALGIDQQVLQRLVAETVLDVRARELLLGVGDTELARQIVEDENLRGGAPSFDRNRFLLLLRENGLTEQAYVEQRRGLTIRRQIADAVTGGLASPGTYDQLLHRFQNERRVAAYLLLEADRFAEVAPPDDATLAAYYELVRAAFRTPELRSADILALTPASVAATITVSEQDARAVYDARPERFGQPGRRRIAQATFPDAAAAAAAAAELAGGRTFEQVLEARNTRLQDVDLGVVTRTDLVDPAVRDAAFALAEGAVSGVVQGRFGPVILRASEVTPESVRPFAEVESQIRGELALERARRSVLDLHDRVEEERVAGTRLAEIAQKVGVPVVSIAAIDRQGRDATGATVTGIPNRQVVDTIFQTPVGGDADGVQLQGGGWVWIDTRAITPERDRPLSETRDAVVARWTAEQRRSRLNTRAGEIAERLRGGGDIDAIGRELGVAVRQSSPFNRQGPVPDFSRAAIDQAFRVARGQPGFAAAETETDVVVFVVTTAELRPLDPATPSPFREELTEALRNDLTSQYVVKLERDMGTVINRTTLDRIVDPASATR
jgi:peptidyl-prolyl cis-trans isomerase D